MPIPTNAKDSLPFLETTLQTMVTLYSKGQLLCEINMSQQHIRTIFSFYNLGGPQGGYHGYNDENYGPPPHRLGPGMGGRGRGSQRYGPAYGPPPPEYGPHADSPVLMVYGLEPSKINTDKVFNIFCLYGNVERVS